MIYLKGLKSEDLGAMVDFLYSGEANVHQENFNSFMTLAKDLQLNGLWGDFLNDDDILYSDAENEAREMNQKSARSPLKKMFSKCQTPQGGRKHLFGKKSIVSLSFQVL